MLPDLLAHRYFGDFGLTQFSGLRQAAQSRTRSRRTLRRRSALAAASWGGRILHREQNVRCIAGRSRVHLSLCRGARFQGEVDSRHRRHGISRWWAAYDDRRPEREAAIGTRRIRISTNLQIYWNSILIDRTNQNQDVRLTPVPLARADLGFHGFPLKIEGTPPGNVMYVYEKTSATGPYTRPAGAYTRYGDVLPLLTSLDDRLVVFGSGDEVALDFDPSKLPALPEGWARDYFFVANGYEKDMDFYAYDFSSVDPLPFRDMSGYPYPPEQSFPLDDSHLNYLLEYNTRYMSGNEPRGYRVRLFRAEVTVYIRP